MSRFTQLGVLCHSVSVAFRALERGRAPNRSHGPRAGGLKAAAGAAMRREGLLALLGLCWSPIIHVLYGPGGPPTVVAEEPVSTAEPVPLDVPLGRQPGTGSHPPRTQPAGHTAGREPRTATTSTASAGPTNMRVEEEAEEAAECAPEDLQGEAPPPPPLPTTTPRPDPRDRSHLGPL